MIPAGRDRTHNMLWFAAPKEQPPLETLRQKDRGVMTLWKVA
jgi:hypothetical protein